MGAPHAGYLHLVLDRLPHAYRARAVEHRTFGRYGIQMPVEHGRVEHQPALALAQSLVDFVVRTQFYAVSPQLVERLFGDRILDLPLQHIPICILLFYNEI